MVCPSTVWLVQVTSLYICFFLFPLFPICRNYAVQLQKDHAVSCSTVLRSSVPKGES